MDMIFSVACSAFPSFQSLDIVWLQCPMQEMAPIKDTVDVLPKVKSLAMADRAMYERGMRAFVSCVQAYNKHECSLIFRVKGKQ